jgi:hypothetical protein
MSVTVKLNQKFIFDIDYASAQIDLFTAFWMVEFSTILVGTWNGDSNIRSTFMTKILTFFPINTMNVVNFPTFNVVFNLRVPKAARKVNVVFFLFNNVSFDFEFKPFSFGDGYVKEKIL